MFTKVKMSFRGFHFKSFEDIQNIVITILWKHLEDDSQEWQKCWNVHIKWMYENDCTNQKLVTIFVFT
jgi:hypothetical protein